MKAQGSMERGCWRRRQVQRASCPNEHILANPGDVLASTRGSIRSKWTLPSRSMREGTQVAAQSGSEEDTLRVGVSERGPRARASQSGASSVRQNLDRGALSPGRCFTGADSSNQRGRAVSLFSRMENKFRELT